MTNEEINIAIAEACGWEPVVISTDMMGNPFPGWDEPPNYCVDLNAMHEAEMTLSKEVRNHYIDFLGDIYLDSWEFATATAKQRAEAFLKTIGKWKD